MVHFGQKSFDIISYSIQFLQAKGDRLYLHETVKIKLSTVECLKKMNSTFPKTSCDYDEEFLFHLLKEVFTKNELRLCGKSSSLRTLKAEKLKLTKGSVNSLSAL